MAKVLRHCNRTKAAISYLKKTKVINKSNSVYEGNCFVWEE